MCPLTQFVWGSIFYLPKLCWNGACENTSVEAKTEQMALQESLTFSSHTIVLKIQTLNFPNAIASGTETQI